MTHPSNEKFPDRDYSEFDYKYRDTKLPHDEINARREVLYVPTGYETKLGRPQYLAVARMMPEGDAPQGNPIIEFPAFTDETAVRPDSSAAFRLAHANPLNRIVYTVQAPGVHSWWMRDMPAGATHRRVGKQLEGLRQDGSFEHIGRACLHAVREADKIFNGGDRREDEVYSLHGSSMGAAIALGALKSVIKDDDRSFRVSGAALSEIVNVRPSVNPITYLGRFAALDTEYVNCNPYSVLDAEESPGSWVRRAISSPAANFGPLGGYGAALARGDEGAFGDLHAYRDAGISIVTAHGTESALTDAESQQQFIVRPLADARVNALHTTHRGHDHGYTLTAQSVVDEVLALEELEDAA